MQSLDKFLEGLLNKSNKTSAASSVNDLEDVFAKMRIKRNSPNFPISYSNGVVTIGAGVSGNRNIFSSDIDLLLDEKENPLANSIKEIHILCGMALMVSGGITFSPRVPIVFTKDLVLLPDMDRSFRSSTMENAKIVAPYIWFDDRTVATKNCVLNCHAIRCQNLTQINKSTTTAETIILIGQKRVAALAAKLRVPTYTADGKSIDPWPWRIMNPAIADEIGEKDPVKILGLRKLPSVKNIILATTITSTYPGLLITKDIDSVPAEYEPHKFIANPRNHCNTWDDITFEMQNGWTATWISDFEKYTK